MRSFIKPGGKLPGPVQRSEFTRTPGLFQKFTNRGREIALHELAAALNLAPAMMRAITSSPSFPTPIGRRCGEGVWLVRDVVTWLADNGWPEDARRLAEW